MAIQHIQARFDGYKDGKQKYQPFKSSYAILVYSNPSYDVEILTNSTSIDQGSTLTIKGLVTETISGTPQKVNEIILLDITEDGEEIETIALSSNTNGIFTYNFTPEKEAKYTFHAQIENGSNYNGGSSNTITVDTTTLSTTTTITVDKTSVYTDQTVLVHAYTVDSNKKKISTGTHRYQTEFYLDGTKVTTFTTKNGGYEASATIAIPTSGTHKIKAKFLSTENYNTSTSSETTITGVARTLQLSVDQSTLYPNYYIGANLVDNLGKGLPNRAVKCKIQSNGINTTKTLTTNAEGYIQTSRYNFTGNVQFTVEFTDTTKKYNNLRKTITIPYSTGSTITTYPKSYSMLKTGTYTTNKKYALWHSLANAINNTNGLYAMCGKGSTYQYQLGGKNGTWPRPAPLKIALFTKNKIPDDANIVETTFRVYLRANGLSSTTSAPAVGKPKINLNSMTKQTIVPNENIQYITSSFKEYKATFTGLNIRGSTWNSNSFYISLDFPANANTNPGYVELNYVEAYVKYIPHQYI